LRAVSAELYRVSPRIRLRIGVTGHRAPPKLPAQSEAPLRALLDRTLAAIVEKARQIEGEYAALPGSDLASPSASAEELASRFVVVSSLAEGSDRIVADAGLAAGFALEVILPLARAEYARDFETEASRAAFARLLERAAAVFDLNGAADDRPRAYEAAGFVMLANIDLLIAIWDGKEAAGIGGTAQIVGRAIADGIPVIWIDPANPNAMLISRPQAGDLPPASISARPQDDFRAADIAAIELAVSDILALPRAAAARSSLQSYLVEKERRWNFCPWYSLLLRLFAGRALSHRDFHLPAALPDTTAQWSSYLKVLPEDRAQRPAIENILLPAVSAADHLAVYYSLVYRSTYIFNFLFAAIAVALALLGIFIHDPNAKSYVVLVELAIIVAILITWLHGHRRQRHRRWLEYRRLAECLRHFRILAPLGCEGSIGRPRRDLDADDEEDWVSWYAWSLRRLIPLPNAFVDAAYLAAMRDATLSAEIAGQLDYHGKNAHRTETLDHRLHHGGQILFATTAGVCAAFLGLVWFVGLPADQEERDLILGVFTFLTALLPTLGAAFAAIHVQGDFQTVAKQSERTAKRLAAIGKVLAEEPLSFARLADRIEKVSQILMAELLEWQTIFRTRPLSLPA
jgi:hypothetical protein